jgi:hypothetical protein
MPSPAPLGPQILDNYMQSQSAQQLVPNFYRDSNPTYSPPPNYVRPQPPVQSAPAPTAGVQPPPAGPSPIGPLTPQAQAAFISELLRQSGRGSLSFQQQNMLGSGKIDLESWLRQLFDEQRRVLGPTKPPFESIPQQLVGAQQQYPNNPLVAQIANILSLIGRPSQRAKPTTRP